MKTFMASEFIDMLQKLINKHGDKPICQKGYYAFDGEVTGVVFHKESVHIGLANYSPADCFCIEPAQNP